MRRVLSDFYPASPQVLVPRGIFGAIHFLQQRFEASIYVLPCHSRSFLENCFVLLSQVPGFLLLNLPSISRFSPCTWIVLNDVNFISNEKNHHIGLSLVSEVLDPLGYALESLLFCHIINQESTSGLTKMPISGIS